MQRSARHPAAVGGGGQGTSHGSSSRVWCLSGRRSCHSARLPWQLAPYSSLPEFVDQEGGEMQPRIGQGYKQGRRAIATREQADCVSMVNMRRYVHPKYNNAATSKQSTCIPSFVSSDFCYFLVKVHTTTSNAAMGVDPNNHTIISFVLFYGNEKGHSWLQVQKRKKRRGRVDLAQESESSFQLCCLLEGIFEGSWAS